MRGQLLAALTAGYLMITPGLLAQPGELPIQLAIRVFDGNQEVTAETTVKVYPAGDHQNPLASAPGSSGETVFTVQPGFYDAQAVQQRQQEVLNIRWAEQLVVMPYPDEAGQHLEVINFQRGFGALQLRPAVGRLPQNWSATAFHPGDRAAPVGRAVADQRYGVFALPAGRYDISIEANGVQIWMADVEVPLGRTRMVATPVR